MRSYRDKPLSPYAKYGKRPFRYSDEYEEWHKAVIAKGGESSATRKLHNAWRAKFPLVPNQPQQEQVP